MIRSPDCPVCQRPLSDSPELRRFAPFCSQRCRQIDLLRWSDGKYVIVDQLPPDVAEELAQSGEIPLAPPDDEVPPQRRRRS